MPSLYTPPSAYMAIVKPFPALRPAKDLAAKICELPYDVVSTAEAREIAAGNPLSFFHVSKPEIDFPPDADPHQPPIYSRGRNNFWHLMAIEALHPDPHPCFYLYRQEMGAHVQLGLVAVASCEDYQRNHIKKHELTRPDKEDDRARHIDILSAQTGPAFLTYRCRPSLQAFFGRLVSGPPEIDFVASDGVRHSSWTVANAEDIQKIEGEFAAIPTLYIADGHHRSAAACRVWQNRHGSGQSAFFLSVIFPHHQMQILPYNRLLGDLNGMNPEALLKRLAEVFEISPSAKPSPAAKHEVGLYLEGKWRSLRFHNQLISNDKPVKSLDASLLQDLVFAPIFNIQDPRTSERIQFVGGIRGLKELEDRVNSGKCACAFSMYPTGIEDLMNVADAHDIMPPKSTWFEPKLRDGMFSHLI
jgi:uncharacterized protein (DUF1015 family)